MGRDYIMVNKDGWMVGRTEGWSDGRMDERKVILMPCMAPTDKLKLSSDELSLSARARFGNMTLTRGSSGYV